jgi:nucleotide-binding universal stress UspA family protein
MKRILVALDGSPRGPAVLAQAVAMATTMNAKLRLFRAIHEQPEVPWDMVHQFPPGGLQELLSQQAKGYLEACLEQVPADLRDGVAAGVGKPWSAICLAARDYAADLIVIGSHGYGPLDYVLGTTAGKVVNHADRSVLVVRAAG